MILCVDPGARCAGYAIFYDDGILREASYAESSYWTLTADSIWMSAKQYPISHVVVERMQVYADMPIPAKDLITLSLMAGRVTGYFPNTPITEYEPRQWKKQTEKKIKTQRIIDELTPIERSRAVAPKKRLAHNMWDAVGIGLYHLRKERRARAKLQ